MLVASLVSPVVPTVAADPAEPAKSIIAQLVFNNTQDPADGFAGSGRPISRSSGGSRGTCDEQLVALLPSSDTLSVSATGCSLESLADLALTTSESPIVWVHVPVLDGPTGGELVLLDENQQALGMQTVSLSGAAGIVGIPLAAKLEVDRTYSWVFTILSEPNRPSENTWVEGLLRRVDPDTDLVTALKATTGLRDRANIWAQHGIWHEALTALIELRQTTPNNATISQDWQDFLSSVELGAIANAPIQDCCF